MPATLVRLPVFSRIAVVFATLGAVTCLGGSALSAKSPTSIALIEKGLGAAVAAGRLTADERALYASTARRAVADLRALPPSRADELRAVLVDVAAQWRAYTRPRALTLFSTLAVNRQQLAEPRPLVTGRDLVDPDGVVYRHISGHGFVFHPLANFARLNNLVIAGDLASAEKLADSLLARAVPWKGGLVWEYLFPFGSGRAPWISGMAEAVAAQALGRIGDALSDPDLLGAADAAYAAIPGRLVMSLSAGPWIELYSFSRTTVLNAQLQTAVSLTEYAEFAGNDAAAGFAARIASAAKALLPSFDTGYWSLYSLRGGEASLAYHDYVVTLLKRLAAQTGDQSWLDRADRFQEYETEPPVVRLGAPVPALKSGSARGQRDTASFRFWLSKLSKVTLKVGGSTVVEWLAHGSHVLVWAPGSRPPKTYRPVLTAVDLAGNKVDVALPPVVVRPR